MSCEVEGTNKQWTVSLMRKWTLLWNSLAYLTIEFLKVSRTFYHDQKMKNILLPTNVSEE